MRCLKGFLCQFGLAGIPSYNEPYTGKNNILPDDKNWLPEGPDHRKNELGVKRFAKGTLIQIALSFFKWSLLTLFFLPWKGYLAYAGSGKNSRSNQLIVALNDNERLGGGSPWEVPWGEIVGEQSYHTLQQIYTGYGEKGPTQGRLHKEGSSEAIQREFPNLDYILGCNIIQSS